jgi:transcriptional regulator with XRE-family HTH domain
MYIDSVHSWGGVIMDIGYKIKEYRNMRDLTITALAEKIGTTRSYMSDIEHSKRTPSFEMITKIADALNIATNDLFVSNDEDLSPTIKKLVNNARQLPEAIIDSVNSMLENLNNNYQLVEKNINGIESAYVIDLNIKPNGLTEEEEVEAQRLIHRLNEIKKQSEEK